MPVKGGIRTVVSLKGDDDRSRLDIGPESRIRIVDYVSEHGDGTSFTNYFWKNCEPHPYEVKRYPLYVQCLLLRWESESIAEIAAKTGVNRASVETWTSFRQKPKLAHYLGLYLKIGKPKAGRVWLSINDTSGH